MSHTHSPAEWAQMGSLAVSLYAAASTPYFLLVDAEVWAWPHPLVAAVDRLRPVVWDVTRSERLYPVWREWDNARHGAREVVAEGREFAADARRYAFLSLRDAALTVAALLALLAPNGAAR